jgi:hypothetical protein
MTTTTIASVNTPDFASVRFISYLAIFGIATDGLRIAIKPRIGSGPGGQSDQDHGANRRLKPPYLQVACTPFG